MRTFMSIISKEMMIYLSSIVTKQKNPQQHALITTLNQKQLPQQKLRTTPQLINHIPTK